MRRFVLTPSLSTIVMFVLLSLPDTSSAAPPQIRSVNIRGLQIGATTVLTLDGTDLIPAPRICLNDQILECSVDPQSTPARVIVSIPLPESTVPGIRPLRLITTEGISNSQLVGLDRFPQIPIAESIAVRPVAVHGSVPGSGFSRTTFQGTAGEDVIIEVEARRLGSKLRPVIHVYDGRRVQVAWASPSITLAGDARILLKLPRDDTYTIEVHDAQYAPPGPSYFRLKVGQWQFADLAFPPAIARGQESTVDLLGNVAGMRVPLRINAVLVVPVPCPNPAVAGGLPPSVLASSLPELVKLPGDQPMPLPGVPIAVSGRLTASSQRDRYLLPAQTGAKLLLEVFAERIGSRIDAVLEIRNPQNAVVASSDDMPNSTDPRLEYTVPAGQESLEITVRDNLNLGGDASIYRLVVTSVDAPQRHFDVVVKSDTVNVAAGERHVLEAFVNRQAYDGPIQLQVANMDGIAVEGTVIPAGANGSLVTVINNGETIAAAVLHMSAQSPEGDLVQPVRIESTPDDRTPLWMREQVAFATTPRASSPFQVTMANEASLTQLVMASKPVITLKLVRPSATYGPIRLALVTSQPPPRLNGQLNPNLAVRAEKAVEIPVDNAVKAAGDALAAILKQLGEATQQAQVAQGDAKVAADAKVTELTAKKSAAETALLDAESKAIYQVDYSVIAPASLLESSCDISIRAELLNPERNTVLRTAYAPVKRMPVLNPLSIAITGTGPFEATLDPAAGAIVKIPARIERFAGYAGAVTVTVTGLPAGVTAGNVPVKPDESEFTVEVKFPAKFALMDSAVIDSIKFTATGPPDPQSGNIPVKSPEVTVPIKITKPAA